ncbi:MAG: hypothetical protein LBG98_00435 [Puniceicoccales bacterium]|jgi:hypothetical protein|nr:hypothetical protein [Puniceicoccales bacterium]
MNFRSCFIGISCALGICCQSVTSVAYQNRIVALVEDQIITQEQLHRDWQASIASSSAQPTGEEFQLALKNHLETMIERTLIVKEFERKKGKIPESFIEQHYQQYLREHFHNQRLQFSEHLHQNGKSLREFKEEIRQYAIVHFMCEEHRKELISPQDIRLHYEQHPETYCRKTQICLQQVLVPIGSEENLKAILEQLLTTWPQGRTLAEMLSLWQTRIPKIRYQDLGWLTLDDLRPELRQAVQKIAIGEHTPWIEISEAFLLLYVVDLQAEYRYTLAEVYRDIQKTLFEQRQQEGYDAWIQQLRQSAFIRYYP